MNSTTIANKEYPFKWVSVSDELEENREILFAKKSCMRNAVVSQPLGIHAPFDMKTRKVAERICRF